MSEHTHIRTYETVQIELNRGMVRVYPSQTTKGEVILWCRSLNQEVSVPLDEKAFKGLCVAYERFFPPQKEMFPGAIINIDDYRLKHPAFSVMDQQKVEPL